MLALDAWWGEPEYKLRHTFTLRGGFILNKLLQRNPATLVYVMTGLYRDEKKDLQDITKFEWQVILSNMGAREAEIKDVQMRMGRP